MIDIFVKYWIQWIFGLIAAGILFWAKHIVKLEKQNLHKAKEDYINEVRKDIVDELTDKIKAVEKDSNENDKTIKEDIEVLSNNIENLTIGVLSMQGRQFREECIRLLDPEHFITFDEYQQFEEDYTAYKGLGGNHTGDALYNQVVKKFTSQVKK